MHLVTCYMRQARPSKGRASDQRHVEAGVRLARLIASELGLPLSRCAISKASGSGVHAAKAITDAELEDVARETARKGRSLFLYFRSAKDLTLTLCDVAAPRLQMDRKLFRSAPFRRRFVDFIVRCCKEWDLAGAWCGLGEPNGFTPTSGSCVIAGSRPALSREVRSRRRCCAAARDLDEVDLGATRYLLGEVCVFAIQLFSPKYTYRTLPPQPVAPMVHMLHSVSPHWPLMCWTCTLSCGH